MVILAKVLKLFCGKITNLLNFEILHFYRGNFTSIIKP